MIFNSISLTAEDTSLHFLKVSCLTLVAAIALEQSLMHTGDVHIVLRQHVLAEQQESMYAFID